MLHFGYNESISRLAFYANRLIANALNALFVIIDICFTIIFIVVSAILQFFLSPLP